MTRSHRGHEDAATAIMREVESLAAQGLRRTAEIGSLYATELVTWEVCFSDEFLAGRRKLRRVLDRRAT